MGVLCSGVSVQPQDSLHGTFPRRTHCLSHVPGWRAGAALPDVGLCPSQCTQSPLHTRDTELFRTVHITCVPAGHLQEAISSFLSFFPSFISLLPFLQMSQNPMSNLTEATVLKSSHQELAHSPALTDVCRLLWFQGKAKK